MNNSENGHKSFQALRQEYWERFHKSYGIVFGDCRPLSYHISVMEEALRTGVPVEIEGIDPNSGVVV